MTGNWQIYARNGDGEIKLWGKGERDDRATNFDGCPACGIGVRGHSVYIEKRVKGRCTGCLMVRGKILST